MRRIHSWEYRDFSAGISGENSSENLGVLVCSHFVYEKVMMDSGENEATFIFSNNDVDRYGDTIDVNGWVLDNYLKNPVALYGHNQFEIEYHVGKTVSLGIDGRNLVGTIKFMSAEENPFAEQIKLRVKNGFLRAVSVGFAPLEWKYCDDPKRKGGIDFIKQELLEISLCPIPALPSALGVKGAKLEDFEKIAEPLPVSAPSIVEKRREMVRELRETYGKRSK